MAEIADKDLEALQAQAAKAAALEQEKTGWQDEQRRWVEYSQQVQQAFGQQQQQATQQQQPAPADDDILTSRKEVQAAIEETLGQKIAPVVGAQLLANREFDKQLMLRDPDLASFYAEHKDSVDQMVAGTGNLQGTAGIHETCIKALRGSQYGELLGKEKEKWEKDLAALAAAQQQPQAAEWEEIEVEEPRAAAPVDPGRAEYFEQLAPQPQSQPAQRQPAAAPLAGSQPGGPTGPRRVRRRKFEPLNARESHFANVTGLTPEEYDRYSHDELTDDVFGLRDENGQVQSRV